MEVYIDEPLILEVFAEVSAEDGKDDWFPFVWLFDVWFTCAKELVADSIINEKIPVKAIINNADLLYFIRDNNNGYY